MPWLKPHVLHKAVTYGRSTLLGIDHGVKRVGIALTDSEWTNSAPLTIIKADRSPQKLRDEILELCVKHSIGGILVGWPVDPYDSVCFSFVFNLPMGFLTFLYSFIE